MFTITLAVLAFQTLIVATFLWKPLRRKSLAVGWTALTVFGTIETAGLLLFQLLTVLVAFLLAGRALARRATQASQRAEVHPTQAIIAAPKAKAQDDLHWYHWIVAIAACSMLYAKATVATVGGMYGIVVHLGYALGCAAILAGVAIILYLLCRGCRIVGRTARFITMTLLIAVYCFLLMEGIANKVHLDPAVPAAKATAS